MTSGGRWRYWRPSAASLGPVLTSSLRIRFSKHGDCKDASGPSRLGTICRCIRRVTLNYRRRTGASDALEEWRVSAGFRFCWCLFTRVPLTSTVTWRFAIPNPKDTTVYFTATTTFANIWNVWLIIGYITINVVNTIIQRWSSSMIFWKSNPSMI